MDPIGNLQAIRYAQDLAEQSTRRLQELSALPTALATLTEASRSSQEIQQALKQSAASLGSVTDSIAQLEAPRLDRQIQQLTEQTLKYTTTQSTALQAMKEAYRRAQEMQQVYERIVGGQSAMGQARQALEDWGSQALAFQECAAQGGRALQSQLEQATANARWLDETSIHTLLTPVDVSHWSVPAFTDPTGFFPFRSIGEEEVERLEQALNRRETVRQDDVHLQAELRELLTVLQDLVQRVVPQDSPQEEQFHPAPLRSPRQELYEKVYQACLNVLGNPKAIPFTQRTVGRVLGMSLSQFKRHLEPYPDLWMIAKRQALIDFKNKPS